MGNWYDSVNELVPYSNPRGEPVRQHLLLQHSQRCITLYYNAMAQGQYAARLHHPIIPVSFEF